LRRLRGSDGNRAGGALPYVAIYRRAKGDDAVSIVRIVHGRRNITRNLVPGAR
jgi:plasmid stabilization system protein ParE